MSNITPVAKSSNAALTYVAATAGGDTIVAASATNIAFLVRNAGSSMTVTFTAVNACNQGFLHNTVVTCAVGDTECQVPANAITTTGNVGVTYSSVTSVTVAAVTG